MKRILSFAVFCLLATPLFAEFALVYKTENAVRKTIFYPGLATPEGIIIQADLLSDRRTVDPHLMVGLQGLELREASMVRFDADLNLALLRLGEVVANKDLQAAHKKNSEKTSLFLPELGVASSMNVSTATLIPGRTEKFIVKLNDQEYNGTDPIVLPQEHKKANVTFALIGQNIEPMWRLTLNIKGEPKLGFWKKGDERGLNAIPQSTLNYVHQAMFTQFANGKVLTVVAEIHYIKQETYNLLVTVDSKAGPFDIKIPVRFVEK